MLMNYLKHFIASFGSVWLSVARSVLVVLVQLHVHGPFSSPGGAN